MSFSVWVIESFALATIAALPGTSPSEQLRHTGTIRGQVTDADSGRPISNVNVFLANTFLGTSTDTNGGFFLRGVPPGSFSLVVSRVGYERQIQSVLLAQGDSLVRNIQLTANPLSTQAIEVSTSYPKDWEENLKRFSRAFIGESNNCRILNPEVLTFRCAHDSLLANADSVLRIENRELGYYLQVSLEDFYWNTAQDYGHYLIYPLFESLRPKSERENSMWEENRLKAYKGSLKHFLHSLVIHDCERELFTVFSGSLRSLLKGTGHRVDPSELDLSPAEGTPFQKLTFPGVLRIEYGQRSDEIQPEEGMYRGRPRRMSGVEDMNSVSVIELKSSFALIDSAGNVLNPPALEVAGRWGENRVSELLPLY